MARGKDFLVYDKNIVLEKLYEDDELVVVVAPNEDQLRDIIIKLLREGPKTVKELHSHLSGLASEDKIRRALAELSEEGLVYSDNEGRYYLAGPSYPENIGGRRAPRTYEPYYPEHLA